MKYLSIFSGIGGFDIALNNNGHQCIGYSEIEKNALAIYKYHFPKEVNYGDATEIKPRELPDFDILVGGFPCQAFSIAGKRRGFDDTRGTLFFDIARIIKHKRPRYLFLENVKGLVNHQKGKTFTKILQTLWELGYSYQWGVVNSRYFGVPQNRERVFIVGNLRTASRPEIFPYTQSTAKISCVEETKKVIVSPHIISPCITTENAHIYGCNVTVGQTFAISKCENIKINNKIPLGKLRRLTPLECERLMGFPDNWTKTGILYDDDEVGIKKSISDTKRYQVLGNAVVVDVVQKLSKQL